MHWTYNYAEIIDIMHIRRIIGNISFHSFEMNKQYNTYNKYRYGISGIMAHLMTYNSYFKHYKIVENQEEICRV